VVLDFIFKIKPEVFSRMMEFYLMQPKTQTKRSEVVDLSMDHC